MQMEVTAMRAHVMGLEGKANALALQRDHYARLFNDSPVGDLILDDRGNILGANRQAAAILGLPQGLPLEGPLTRFVHKADIPEFLEHLRRSQSSIAAVSTELRLALRRHRSLPIELISVPVQRAESGPGAQLRTLLIDITRRKSAQDALHAARENHRALIDSIEGIVWEADPSTLRVLFVSQFAERLLGHSLNSWFQPGFWPHHIHITDRERVLDEVAKALRAGDGNYMVDYRMLDAQQRTLWVRDTLTVFTQDGKTRLLGVAVNITDRKELEARLGEAQGMLEQRVYDRTSELTATVSDLEAFSYSISHDLRAPLRAMEGYAQILQQRLNDKLQPIEKDFLNRIAASAQRLDGLVQDVLKYSSVARTPLDLRSVDVDELVQGIIRDYPNLQPPKAHIEVQKPLHPVKGNEAFLTQCISNLLSNAVKFVKPGNHPHVRVWTQELRGATVRLWFEDNGIGVAAENRRRIFGIFQRMHSQKEYEGTGIGLAIVKKAAERMGGKVGLESALGRGSKFWLELPRA